MTIGRFWLVLPMPRLSKPRYGKLHGTLFFHWGGFSIGLWSKEKWASRYNSTPDAHRAGP